MSIRYFDYNYYI